MVAPEQRVGVIAGVDLDREAVRADDPHVRVGQLDGDVIVGAVGLLGDTGEVDGAAADGGRQRPFELARDRGRRPRLWLGEDGRPPRPQLDPGAGEVGAREGRVLAVANLDRLRATVLDPRVQ
jgi:hypothetical protein